MGNPRSVKLDPDIGKRLDNLAVKRDRKPHWLMVTAIARFVEHEERLQLHIDAAKTAWAKYQVTNSHADHPQVDAWLQRLGAGQRAKAPQCR